MRKSSPFLALIAALVALDQASKFLIVKNVVLYESFQVIPGFFNITRIHNKGATFGF
ncbi:MAG: signal peptidase II, partial [Acidobacteriota bacterium]|nr:signal peptidase II [Acidobacteriota bacterium]